MKMIDHHSRAPGGFVELLSSSFPDVKDLEIQSSSCSSSFEVIVLDEKMESSALDKECIAPLQPQLSGPTSS